MTSKCFNDVLWLEYWGEVRQEDSLGVITHVRWSSSLKKRRRNKMQSKSERETKKVCLSGQGKRETEESEGWLPVTNAVQKSKRMRTKIHGIFQKGLQWPRKTWFQRAAANDHIPHNFPTEKVMKTITDCYTPGNAKGKAGYAVQRWRSECILLRWFTMQVLSVFWKIFLQ